MSVSDDDGAALDEDLELGSGTETDKEDAGEQKWEDEFEASVAASTSGGKGGGGKAGRAKGRGRHAAAATDAGRGGGGKSKGKVAPKGMKWCNACGKVLPLDQFPPGSGQCHTDRQAVQNLSYAAKVQGQLDWWDEQRNDPKKFRRVIAYYKAKVPTEASIGAKKTSVKFKVNQYLEYCRQEEIIMRDGVHEMMDIREYMSWMAKAKNGALDALTSSAKFNEKFEEPHATTDEDGDWSKDRRRVMVKKKTVATFRDQEVRGRQYEMRDKESKDCSQEQIDRLEGRVQRGSTARGASAQSRAETARTMLRTASASSGMGADGSFSEQGRAILQIGQVRELASDTEEAEGLPEEETPHGGGRRRISWAATAPGQAGSRDRWRAALCKEAQGKRA